MNKQIERWQSFIYFVPFPSQDLQHIHRILGMQLEVPCKSTQIETSNNIIQTFTVYVHVFRSRPLQCEPWPKQLHIQKDITTPFKVWTAPEFSQSSHCRHVLPTHTQHTRVGVSNVLLPNSKIYKMLTVMVQADHTWPDHDSFPIEEWVQQEQKHSFVEQLFFLFCHHLCNKSRLNKLN